MKYFQIERTYYWAVKRKECFLTCSMPLLDEYHQHSFVHQYQDINLQSFCRCKICFVEVGKLKHAVLVLGIGALFARSIGQRLLLPKTLRIYISFTPYFEELFRVTRALVVVITWLYKRFLLICKIPFKITKKTGW